MSTERITNIKADNKEGVIEVRPNGDPYRGNYCYEYPRPALTADCVIFGFDNDSLRILLIERGIDPFKGSWALPGGFMRMQETIDQCAMRELKEETGVADVYLQQFRMFSDPDRDPRGRVVTMAFIALVRPDDYKVIGGDDASDARWFDIDYLPPLAFDHMEIVRQARTYLKELIRTRPVAFRLLNTTFGMDELRKVYEAINEASYDRRNFERKAISSGVVAEDSTTYANSSSRRNRKFSVADRLKNMFSGSIVPPEVGGKFRSDVDSDDRHDDSDSIKDIFSF